MQKGTNLFQRVFGSEIRADLTLKIRGEREFWCLVVL